VRHCIAVVYNEPVPGHYDEQYEHNAVKGILEAMEAVYDALIELGYEAVKVSLAPPISRARQTLDALEVDLVFNLFEGFADHPETEVQLAEILTALGVPFTGSPPAVLKLALDKAKTKTVLRGAGINTPDFQLLRPETLSSFRLGYPCIVKPRRDDASNGLSSESVVYDFASLEKQVTAVSRSYGGQALVEHFLDGGELNATVLGDTVLPVSEIDYSLPAGVPRLLTFAAKWQPDSLYFQGTEVVCPAEIEDEERDDIAQTALTVFDLLGCCGYARVDMRRDGAGQLNVIEVNPNPDISPDAGAARQAQAAGMAYPQFIDKIVKLALEKKGNDDHDTPHAKKGQAISDGAAAQPAPVQTTRGGGGGGGY
jgi:D-alanine-D-alanine ligase